MEALSDLKAALWGAAAGEVVLGAVGFMPAGWVTHRTAEAEARQLTSRKVVSAMARVCAEKFRQQPDVAASLDQFKAVSSWQRGRFVERGGWATMPGSSAPHAAVVSACAEMLGGDL